MCKNSKEEENRMAFVGVLRSKGLLCVDTYNAYRFIVLMCLHLKVEQRRCIRVSRWNSVLDRRKALRIF